MVNPDRVRKHHRALGGRVNSKGEIKNTPNQVILWLARDHKVPAREIKDILQKKGKYADQDVLDSDEEKNRKGH